MSEAKLEKEIETYKELAKQDKKIDVASLMINALQKSEGNKLSPKEKKWAYLIAIGLPPLGLLFALKFYFSDKDDAKEAALVCVVITALGILLLIVFGKLLLSTGSVSQLQQLNPKDIQQLYQ